MCAGGFHCTRLSLTFLNILYLAFSITIIAVACWARNVGMIISPPIIGGKLKDLATLGHRNLGLAFGLKSRKSHFFAGPLFENLESLNFSVSQISVN